MNKDSCIWVAGYKGLVGSAIVNHLKWLGYTNLVFSDQRLDQDFDDIFPHKVDYVFLCAAKVGGIHANNTYPADFIYSNIKIATNVIDWCNRKKVKKLLYLGSSCIYPRDCPQPIKEEYLMTGPLESTNSAYAVAKIAGIEVCKSYYKQHGLNSIIVMPCNLYGPRDNFDIVNGHVLPSLIYKCHEAKINNTPYITLWGDGSAYREFLYVEDLADACVTLMKTHNYDENHPVINVGMGKDITIKDLIKIVKRVVKYDGEIIWDTNKPNGTPKKLLDTSYINDFGWWPRVELNKGIKKTYEWFLNNKT